MTENRDGDFYCRSLIAIDAADRKKLEEKVFHRLARMPPLRGEGDAFRKKLTRNREGNMMREEYHQAAAMDTTTTTLKEEPESALADDWEELDNWEESEVKREIKEPQETCNEPSDLDDRLASEFRDVFINRVCLICLGRILFNLTAFATEHLQHVYPENNLID